MNWADYPFGSFWSWTSTDYLGRERHCCVTIAYRTRQECLAAEAKWIAAGRRLVCRIVLKSEKAVLV
ncbi:hypothetical protein [Agrobacterium vitis]|uniref:hypothetical protein n=1 Tax=Agrobacterium vitis TaxID=373 RepID=UPI0008DC1F54|nr:hypothetical protein [Agrobacterium vitis]MUO84795.1 hypothetical protein [Agrobacterium vitis]